MINIEKSEKIDIITFSVSNINALITEEIKAEIMKVIDNPNCKLLIDLSGVKYIDSSGFGCFLSLMKAARSNYGVLRFSNPEPKIMELFITLHLHTVFQIFDSREAGIASFK